MKLNIIKIKDNAIEKATDILKEGGIVIHPTDTCYGIAADIFNKSALEKIYKFKGRDFNKPVSVIVKDYEQFKVYGEWHSLIQETIEKNSNQYSFVVKKKSTLPEYLNPSFDTIGIQIPKYEFSLAMLEKFGLPLVATSANLSGMENTYSTKDLLIKLKNANVYPDLIIDGGKLSFKKPSRMIQIIDGETKVLR